MSLIPNTAAAGGGEKWSLLGETRMPAEDIVEERSTACGCGQKYHTVLPASVTDPEID
jgi:hypothetical protein